MIALKHTYFFLTPFKDSWIDPKDIKCEKLFYCLAIRV